MIDILIVVSYLLGVLVVGILAGRKIKNIEDFSVADRKYTTPVLVAALAATGIGGGSTIGVSEKVFNKGLIFILLFCISQFVYRLIMGYLIAPRMAKFKGLISVGGVMGHLYGKPGRILTGFLASCEAIGSVGAQVIALGYLFNFLLGMPFLWGVIIGGGVVIIYSGFGGIRAVTITDVVQFAVLIVAIPVICMVGLDVVGGYKGLLEKIPSGHLSIFPQDDPKIEYIILFVIFTVPFLDSACVQRILMAKSVHHAAKANKINALIALPFFFLVGIIGLVAVSLNPEINGHVSLPYLVKEILPVGFKGLAISGMLAVIMSTADSYLNIASISFVHDVVNPLRKTPMSSASELKVVRIATFVMGALTIVVATNFTSVLDLVISILYFWAPIVSGPFYAGLFNLRGNTRSFITSAIMGAGTAILWNLTLDGITGMDGLIPGFLANLFTTLSFHFYLKKAGYVPHYMSDSDSFEVTKTIHKASPGWWKIALMKIKSGSLSLKSVGFGLKSRIEGYGMQYVAFGVFAVINYMFPYFMWTSSDFHQGVQVALRVSAGIAAFMLIMRDFWPVKLEKYFSYYWIGALFFCLPFYTTYMSFAHDVSTFWLINMALASFLLALLVDWACFLFILPLGILSGWAFFSLVHGSFSIPVAVSEKLPLILYVYVFSSLIGLIFSRNKDRENEEKQQVAKSIARNVAHELRTPLTAITCGYAGITEPMSEIERLYLEGNNGNGQEFAKNLGLIKEVLARNETISENTLGLIDIQLQNLRGPQQVEKLQLCSMEDCINKALATYPFRDGEQNLVKVNISNNFNFKGDEQLFTHVVYNLLKNALYFIRSQNDGAIEISSMEGDEHNLILFRDTGPGVAEGSRPYIFNPFYTAKSGGNGVGLGYCKEVMLSFGGDILYLPSQGRGATFALCFLK